MSRQRIQLEQRRCLVPPSHFWLAQVDLSTAGDSSNSKLISKWSNWNNQGIPEYKQEELGNNQIIEGCLWARSSPRVPRFCFFWPHVDAIYHFEYKFARSGWFSSWTGQRDFRNRHLVLAYIKIYIQPSAFPLRQEAIFDECWLWSLPR